MINDHVDGWFDGIFPGGTTIRYTIVDPGCEETQAAKAYWDTRNAWVGNVHAVVGCRCSDATIAVARIASLDKVPQVTPSASSPKLSDKEDFPFVSSMVAPDALDGEIGAMITMLQSFNWDRVSILGVDSEFATDYITTFEDLWKGMYSNDVAYSSTITFAEDKVDGDSVRTALAGVPTDDPARNSRVILLVANVDDAYDILKMAGDRGFQKDTIWVGPRSWVGRSPSSESGFDFSLYPDYTVLGLMPFRDRDGPYQDYLRRLQEMQRYNGLEEMKELPDYTAEFLIDSILSVTKALTLVPITQRLNGTYVTSMLRNLTFAGVSGEVKFTAEGNRQDPRYNILNLKMLNSVLSWNEVGVATPNSSEPELNNICSISCPESYNLEGKYPVPPPGKTPLPIWVIVIIPVLSFLLIVVLFKYWRSRLKKKTLKSRVKAIDREMRGIDNNVEDAQRRKASLMTKRAALIERPATWSPTTDILVEVCPEDPQYWAVCKRLKGDLVDAHISKVWRVQNIALWSYYTFHRDRLVMNDIDPNEISVWHGTSGTDPSIIYKDRQDGFMMQYSQTGYWGRGIYFADKSSYSHPYAYTPSLGVAKGVFPKDRSNPKDGEREMFLAKLLVGSDIFIDRDESPSKADQCAKIIIPPIDPNTGLKYNTVSGNSAGSKVWAVYENGRAYPDYLVRYYCGKRDRRRTPFDNETEAMRKSGNYKMVEASVEDVEDVEDIEMPNGYIRIIWEYLGDDGWNAYEDHHQAELESLYHSFNTNTAMSSKAKLRLGMWAYEVDIFALTQKNISHYNKRERSIRRRVDVRATSATFS